MLTLECVVLGEQSLLIQCCEELLARGHRVKALVAHDRRIVEWSATRGIPCLDTFDQLREVAPFDALFSITNLKMLPDWLLQLPQRHAINFHDGPLPRYAGLNVPVWALLNNETEHGITWHQMAAGADTGSILVSRRFPIVPGETAFSLNTKCYEAGLDGFVELLDRLQADTLQPLPQDLAQRSYFGLSKRPASAALLDWRQSAAVLDRTIKALDFGQYPNPVMLPKIDLGSRLLLARQSLQVDAGSTGTPGTIEAFCAKTLTVRCADASLKILRVTDQHGADVDVAATLQALGLGQGDLLPSLDAQQAQALDAQVAALCKYEDFWHRRLLAMEPVELPFASRANAAPNWQWQTAALPALPPGESGSPAGALVAALALLLGRLAGKNEFTLAFVPEAAQALPPAVSRFFETVVPLPVTIAAREPFSALSQRIDTAIADAERRVAYLGDLRARAPDLKGIADCGGYPVRVLRSGHADEAAARRACSGAALCLQVAADGRALGVLFDAGQIDASAVSRLLGNLEVLAQALATHAAMPVAVLPLLTAADTAQLAGYNGVHAAVDGPQCVHELFERQVLANPQHAACIFEGQTLTYQQLNDRANQLAHYLRSNGVQQRELVGVLVERSLDMLVALYAVHKAGCAYVPLDPLYPADRLAYMIEDAGLRTVITQRAFAAFSPATNTVVLQDVAPQLETQPRVNPGLAVAPADLAYVIYTSGSTGQPKGVMVEHRNVVNFFVGMDQTLENDPGLWLAVTSISFDISVLELFWTLARGFTVLLYADAVRQKAPRPADPSRRVEFGLFYWNVATDASQYDQNKYRLLLEGAKFADSHGFNAVWTPERHFAAFGGLFPNPSVTSAALATITSNVSLRAGSCVVPLHSPIRLAEEWAVVDNLSNGRTGMAIAAGWAPPDFAIMPANYAEAKKVMFESAALMQRLWRGETIDFPGPTGPVPVRTLPRPIQKQLPLWVTTAGNIDTYVQAAKIGANVLTHLLGQTVEEVAEKVRAYRAAWAEAGHPGKGTVTLMLHTLVGPDLEAVEQAVRGPLKEYLKSAMFLVKAAAWNFPTFKKMSDEQGKTLDDFFATISDDDMDGLLEFAFRRYFHDSGLFGTPSSCMAMVDRVKAADVDEIACLIDYGIDADTVLAHLPYLDQLRTLAQQTIAAGADDEDYSLPALLKRYPVTHLQCTPSMATMLAADADARPGLARLKQMMVGGEAFPPELARDLKALVGGRVTNMYGPTETTIWSAVGDVDGAGANVSVGRPLANQSVYILDQNQQPLPPGIAGELVIGGRGVVRGYWQRAEMTAERFLPDPFADQDAARMYRTGDLARYLPDGRIECLGRVDHQVKIRGYRVELGEIEAQLRGHDSVREAAVLLREDVPGDKRLVAYVRPAAGAGVNADALREHLRSALPDFMVPSTYVEMAALPLTPNGKIDRKALPVPPQQSGGSGEYVAPQNDAEAMIADIWKRVLGIAQVGTRENFFDIGGHSLLVVQVLKELRERVSKPVQMTDLFKYTTIEALAGFIGGDDKGGDDPLNRSKGRAEARRAAMNRRRG